MTQSMTSMHDFYFIYPQDLSDLGLLELKEKYRLLFESDCDIKSIDDSGILITCELNKVFILHQFLKTPTRILLRITDFIARDFPKLYNKSSKINWKPYLIGHIPEVHVSSHESRLFDSRKISKAITDGIQESYKKQPIKQKYLDLSNELTKIDPKLLPSIYYRSVKDLVTLSIDLSGELLHKRGDKKYTGLAPIRENLASLLLIELKQNIQKLGLLNIQLIDPMCGSGTFLIEAHDYEKKNSERSYAFQSLPLYLENINAEKFEGNVSQLPLFRSFQGYDESEQILSQAKLNSQNKFINYNLHNILKNESIKNLKIENDSPIVVITNPPYGVRIGDKQSINKEYYEKLVEQIISTFSQHLKMIGIIIPKDQNPRFKNVTVLSKRAFKNGGLELYFYVLKIND